MTEIKKCYIKGKLLAVVQNKLVQSRDRELHLVKFRVQDGMDLWTCNAWEDQAALAASKLPGREGSPITVEGTQGRNPHEMSVKIFILPTAPIQSSAEAQTESQDDKADYIRRQLDAGYVQVPIVVREGSRIIAWKHKDDCIYDDGKWKWKIEYLHERLGAKRVSEEFRKAFGMKTTSAEEVARARITQDGVREVLARLEAEAEHFGWDEENGTGTGGNAGTVQPEATGAD